MKKGKHYRKNTKRLSLHKGLLLAAVSLLLVGMTAVTTTISWIEDVSQVEFNTNDNSQQTPVHIGKKILKSDAVMKSNPTGTTEVNLEDYFNKSGDMHLSPCYGDGENFYFPIVTATNGGFGFRTGTKDDANVNYLSATFRLKSEGANTAYWFEKTGNTPYITFKDGGAEGNPVSDLEQYLRCSITVDGATTVYALNNNGKFNTVNGTTVTPVNGKRMDEYAYYQEPFDDNTKLSELDYSQSSKYVNQGGGSNLNGNTLFNVNQYASTNRNTVKTVTVKIWLEYSNATGTNLADIASVNMNLVSSWAKTRRIFVKDNTVHQVGYDNKMWLPTYDSTLWFGLRSNLDTHWRLSRISNTNIYFADIPAVYNNYDVVFLRCTENGWGTGDSEKTYTSGEKTVHYWNMWETTFPDSFHSETYTVYSTDFATWEEDSNVHAVYIVNSAFFNNMYDYMWDSNSVINQDDINAKVVKNANWPGIQMTTKLVTQAKTESNKTNLDVYAFFYNSNYDRVIFNDGDLVQGKNQEYQTQDLWIGSDQINDTFDMSTLTWFNTNPTQNDWLEKMPTFSDNESYIYGNFSTNNAWKKTRLAFGGEYGSTSGNAFNGTTNDSSTRKLLCKIYIKNAGSYALKLCFQNNWYGASNSGNYDVDFGGSSTKEYEVYSDDTHTHNLELNNVPKGILRIYVQNGTSPGRMKLYFAHNEN